MFASGSFQIIIADTFNVDQSTVSRAVHSVCNTLVRRSHMFIKFPTAQGIEENKRKFYDIGNFPNIFGLIDGTHVRIIAPSQHEDQFVNRKGYHSINVQVVVNADSQFINIVAKWPGISHDPRVLKESAIFRHLEQSNIDGYLLRDSGYPCKKFLLTPYLQRQSRQEIRYNRSHKVTVCLWLRRCKETSVFAVAHILSHFFCISLMSLCTEFPAFTMFAISCHAIFLSPEVIDEENSKTK